MLLRMGDPRGTVPGSSLVSEKIHCAGRNAQR
jgi:hypothetical protein